LEGSVAATESQDTMKILGWNFQGLNSSRAVLALQDILRQHKPDVVFLSETHLSRAKADKLMRKMGFQFLLIDESDGRSGGLLMMWKKEVNIIEKSVTNQHIDVRHWIGLAFDRSVW
jgi:exonuclease III